MPQKTAKGTVPKDRIEACNGATVRGDGGFVLYWMIASRRVQWNFSLDRAVEWARETEQAPDDSGSASRGLPVGFGSAPWVHPSRDAEQPGSPQGEKRPLLPVPGSGRRRGEGAAASPGGRCLCCWSPMISLPFFCRAWSGPAAQKLSVRLEKVDGNGMLPMGVTDKVFTTAYSFRRFLQKTLPERLVEYPNASPFEDTPLRAPAQVKKGILERWPSISLSDLKSPPSVLKRLPIDHGVHPVPGEGGAVQGERLLDRFMKTGLFPVFAGSQPSRFGGDQPFVPLSSFRTHLRPPGVLPDRSKGGLAD